MHHVEMTNFIASCCCLKKVHSVKRKRQHRRIVYMDINESLTKKNSRCKRRMWNKIIVQVNIGPTSNFKFLFSLKREKQVIFILNIKDLIHFVDNMST